MIYYLLQIIFLKFEFTSHNSKLKAEKQSLKRHKNFYFNLLIEINLNVEKYTSVPTFRYLKKKYLEFIKGKTPEEVPKGLTKDIIIWLGNVNARLKL